MMKLIPLLAATLLLPGCLAYEEDEFRILREQGDPAVIILDFTNIYSDETDTAKIQKDFTELLDDWHGSEWLKKSRKENIILKSRDVYVRDGKIAAREP